MFVSSMGSFSLSSNITLLKVLYVHDLKCTLISIVKLLKQLNCFAMFTDTICVLHDHFLRTLVGVGEERDGVYYFTNLVSAKSHHIVGTSDQDLWHRRLGHPYFSVFLDLSFLTTSFISTSSSPCDIYFRANQTREVFYDSMNKTS